MLNSITKFASDAITKVTETHKLTEVSQNEFNKSKKIVITPENQNNSTVDRQNNNQDLITLYQTTHKTVGVEIHFFDIVLKDRFNPTGFLIRLSRVGSEEEAKKIYANYSKKLPLFVFSSRKTYQKETLQLLCDTFRAHPNWTPGRLAVEIGFTEVFEEPGAKLADSTYINEISPADGQNAIMACILKLSNVKKDDKAKRKKIADTHLNLLDVMMGFHGADIELINPKTGESVWHYAVMSGEIKFVELVSRYASSNNINHVSHNGAIPLGIAAANDDVTTCKLLVKSGAKWHVDAIRPPIHIAVHADARNVLKLILREDESKENPDEEKVDITLVDALYCSTPLHWARSKEVAQLLVEKGKIDANYKSTTDDTALHIAIKKKRQDVSYYLILADCDLNTQNTAGETPLHLAIMADDLKLVRGLLLFGARSDIQDAQGNTAGMIAIKNQGQNRDDILKSMQEVGAVSLDCIVNSMEKSEKSLEDMEMVQNSELATAPKMTENSMGVSGSLPSHGKEIFINAEYTSGMDLSTLENEKSSKFTSMNSSRNSLSGVGLRNCPRKLRILSLDGGGVRGIVLTKILQAIEHEAKRPAHELFDWIIGTSTGAILAAGLACKKSPAYCQRLYFKLKDEVFKGSRPYSEVNLENFLKSEFGEKTMMTSIKDHKLILTTALADRHPTELFLFRSYDPKAAEPRDRSRTTVGNELFEPLPKPDFTPIWEALRSSSAAPSFFKPHKERFMDGGMISNNPTMDVLTEIERYQRAVKAANRAKKLDNYNENDNPDLENDPSSESDQPDNLDSTPVGVVLSVGTGRLPTSQISTVNIQIPTGLFSAIDTYHASKNVANMLLDAATETDRYIVDRTEAWCRMIEAKYFRLNSQLKDETPLDTVNDEILMQILWETEIYVHKNRAQIKKLARCLNAYG